MNMYLFLITPIIIGFIMGVLSHTRKYDGNIVLPKTNDGGWNPGFIIDGAYGSLASIIAVIVASPSEMERVVLLSILAGYLGEILIDQLASKMLSETKYQKVEKTFKKLDDELDDEDEKSQ